MTMNIRSRDGSNAERASGRRVGSGRRRTVDVDENHNYHPVAFRVSDALYRKLRLAVALSGSPTQQGFIIEALEPAIDKVLEKTATPIKCLPYQRPRYFISFILLAK